MHIISNRLSFFLTAIAMVLIVAGLLLPATFRAAPAQTLAPSAQLMQPQPISPASSDQEPQTTPAAVVEQRDPFVSEEARVPGETRLPPDVRFISVPTMWAGSRTPAPEAPHDDLTGVVVGDHSYALVGRGGKTRLLSIGDIFQGRKIMTITLQGVALDDHSIARIPLLDQ